MAKSKNIVTSSSRTVTVGRERPIGKYGYSVYESSRGSDGNAKGAEVSFTAESGSNSAYFTFYLDAHCIKSLAVKLAEVAGMKLVSKETETETA